MKIIFMCVILLLLTPTVVAQSHCKLQSSNVPISHNRLAKHSYMMGVPSSAPTTKSTNGRGAADRNSLPVCFDMTNVRLGPIDPTSLTLNDLPFEGMFIDASTSETSGTANAGILNARGGQTRVQITMSYLKYVDILQDDGLVHRYAVGARWHVEATQTNASIALGTSIPLIAAATTFNGASANVHCYGVGIVRSKINTTGNTLPQTLTTDTYPQIKAYFKQLTQLLWDPSTKIEPVEDSTFRPASETDTKYQYCGVFALALSEISQGHSQDIALNKAGENVDIQSIIKDVYDNYVADTHYPGHTGTPTSNEQRVAKTILGHLSAQ